MPQAIYAISSIKHLPVMSTKYSHRILNLTKMREVGYCWLDDSDDRRKLSAGNMDDFDQMMVKYKLPVECTYNWTQLDLGLVARYGDESIRFTIAPMLLAVIHYYCYSSAGGG
jgi:hypothetical protein